MKTLKSYKHARKVSLVLLLLSLIFFNVGYIIYNTNSSFYVSDSEDGLLSVSEKLSENAPITGIVLLYVFAALFFIGAIAWICAFLRCPHCHHTLFWCRILPRFCPDCGEELD